MKTPVLALLGAAACAALAASTTAANAQNARTWVAAFGDDISATCSRVAPCKTFSGAMSKTTAGGEINCVDAAGYGVLVINKALTIDCTGTYASILATGAGNALTIAAGTNDKVIIRGLSINGANLASNGISWTSGGHLHIENTRIFNFTTSGINVATSTTHFLYLRELDDHVGVDGNFA